MTTMYDDNFKEAISRIYFEKRTFVNDNGQTIDYDALCMKIQGETFVLKMSSADKKLLQYILVNKKDDEL